MQQSFSFSKDEISNLLIAEVLKKLDATKNYHFHYEFHWTRNRTDGRPDLTATVSYEETPVVPSKV